MTEFPQRQIGHTGLQVTELGLGCATLGGSLAWIIADRWPERIASLTLLSYPIPHRSRAP